MSPDLWSEGGQCLNYTGREKTHTMSEILQFNKINYTDLEGLGKEFGLYSQMRSQQNVFNIKNSIDARWRIVCREQNLGGKEKPQRGYGGLGQGCSSRDGEMWRDLWCNMEIELAGFCGLAVEKQRNSRLMASI